MLKGVRQFLADIARSGRDAADAAPIDERLASAALLVHVTSIDGEVSEAERGKLRALLTDRFELHPNEAAALIDRANRADADAVDLYAFTSVLKARLDEPGRLRIIEMMWEMVFADGQVHEFEENLVWRAAELLGVSSRDRVRLKQTARRRQAD